MDYDSLLTVYPGDKDLIDSMIDIILETVVAKSPTIRVAKAECPKDLVKGHLPVRKGRERCYSMIPKEKC